MMMISDIDLPDPTSQSGHIRLSCLKPGVGPIVILFYELAPHDMPSKHFSLRDLYCCTRVPAGMVSGKKGDTCPHLVML